MPPFTVPGTGIEPVQPQWPQDFKSCVSTSSTTRAAAAKVKKAFKQRALFGDFFKKKSHGRFNWLIQYLLQLRKMLICLIYLSS